MLSEESHRISTYCAILYLYEIPEHAKSTDGKSVSGDLGRWECPPQHKGFVLQGRAQKCSEPWR